MEKIAVQMLQKLDSYQARVNSPLVNLARILNAIVGSVIGRDSELIRSHVTLPLQSEPMNDIEKAPSGTESSANILQELLEERSQDQYQEDEVTSFLRATRIGDPIIYPLQWWSVN